MKTQTPLPLERLLHLQGAINRSGNKATLEEVLYELECGHAQLWEAENATVVTQVSDYGDFRCLNVWLAGGNLDEIIGLLDAAEDFARYHGCDRIEVTGRMGWKRALKDHGFEPTSIVLEKRI